MQRLRSNARVLRRALDAEGIPVQDTEMHIVPVIAGTERDASSLCEAVLKRGVFAQAIRPPTVAQGTSRLRLAVMASHTPEELREAARAIGAAARELGLDLTVTASRAARASDHAIEAGELERQVSTLAPSSSSSSSPFSPHEELRRTSPPCRSRLRSTASATSWSIARPSGGAPERESRGAVNMACRHRCER